MKLEYKRAWFTLFLFKYYVVTWEERKSGLSDAFAWFLNESRISYRTAYFKTKEEAEKHMKQLELILN